MSAKKTKNTNRRVHFNRPLEKRVKDYSLAAVGMGAIAFSPAANAAVVTVPLNHTVALNTTYTVTVDGHNVMALSNTSSSTSTFAVVATSGVFWGPAQGARGALPPVTAGHAIPGGFPSNTGGLLVFSTEKENFKGFLGNQKFIGFSFGTGPNIHYGWIQFNISQSSPHSPYTVVVVNAAYETVAGLAIDAGATTDNVPTTPAPNTLWLMALGAAGVAGFELLRRRRAA